MLRLDGALDGDEACTEKHMRPTRASVILASMSLLCGVAAWQIVPNLSILLGEIAPAPSLAAKLLFVPGAAGWLSVFLALAVTNIVVGFRYRGWRVNLLFSSLLLILVCILISATIFLVVTSRGGISGIRA